MPITGTSGDDDLVGTTGNDQFDVFQGGDDRMEGDLGTDTFNFGTAYTSADRVDGGDGNDTVNISGTYAGPIVLAHLTSVETFQALSGSFQMVAKNSAVGAGATLTIAAAALTAAQSLTFNGSKETDGKFTFNLGAGNDVARGGAGNDGFSLGNGGDDTCVGGVGDDSFFCGAKLTAADHLNGGTGTDFLQLNGDYSAGVVFGKHTVESIETLQIIASNACVLTTHDTTVSAGATLTTTVSTSFAITFDGSDESDGNFTITTGGGADRLTGGDGNDTFTAGNGADVLSGLGGTDTFNYASATQSTGAAHDNIKGFVAADDLINTPAVIVAIDAEVTHGKLTSARFDAQLARAVGANDLGVAHAVVFTPDAGNLAGHTFVVVNLNATAGYQAGLDLVIELVNADLTGIGTANFI